MVFVAGAGTCTYLMFLVAAPRRRALPNFGNFQQESVIPADTVSSAAGSSDIPSCSVVIPTHRRPDDLERCLSAIAEQDYRRFDVIVVDNSAGDSETREVAKRWKARYVTETKRGLCRARNRGALVSSADIIAYLDDDSIPEPNWLAGLANEFRDPDVMGVGGKTVPLRIVTDSERLFAQVRGGAYNRPAPLVVDRNTPYWFEICGFGGIGAGCNMAVRRAAFEVWPGFHERTDRGTPVYGGGEQHAFFSLVDRGFKVCYTPHAVVRHPFPPTMDMLKRRYLHDLTASTAYFTMLLVEETGHRRSTMRYLWEAIRGKERTWRGDVTPRPKVVSRLSTTFALLLGPVRYIQGVLLNTPN
ncbi:MAG: glycosyltransferase family 2 protein [Gemmatimonadales bacterium]